MEKINDPNYKYIQTEDIVDINFKKPVKFSTEFGQVPGAAKAGLADFTPPLQEADSASDEKLFDQTDIDNMKFT